MEAIGTISALCFMFSAFPLVWEAMKTGKVGIPWAMIGLVLIGSFGMGVYGFTIDAAPVVLNQIVTFTCWAIVAAIKGLGVDNGRS